MQGPSTHLDGFEVLADTLGEMVSRHTPDGIYTYDLVVLAVPLAFLWRMGRTSGFLPHELSAIALACLLILIFPFVTAPVGLGAVLIVAALIARRALAPNPLAPAAA